MFRCPHQVPTLIRIINHSSEAISHATKITNREGGGFAAPILIHGGRSGMLFKVEDYLTEVRLQEGLRWITRDGITTQAMVTFTSGAFLIAFALKLGASNLQIGLLAAIGPLAQLLQLPGIYLVERIRNRRLICVWAGILGRSCWLFIGLIPLAFQPELGVILLLGAVIFYSLTTAISGCSWNSWMRDLVPQNILGTFFSRRMSIAIGVGIVLSLLAAGYLDLWKKYFSAQETQGYSILFFISFLAGLSGVYIVSRIPEPRMAASHVNLNFLELLRLPFRDTNYRKLIVFLCSWNFAVNLAAPFFMVYMLKRLGLSMSFIIGMTILSQVVNIIFLKIWGRFTDTFSNKSVLAICGPLVVFSILAWTFTTLPEKYFLTIPLVVIIHVVLGISSSGVALATGNIGLKLAPKGQATSYLATNTIFNSLAAGIAPILGGKFADFFAARELDWTIKYTSPSHEISLPTLNLQQWDFFFFLAFLLGLYALHRLTLVREVGEVEEKVVLRELVNEVKLQIRTVSSAVGLRQVISFPVVILNRLVKNNKE